MSSRFYVTKGRKREDINGRDDRQNEVAYRNETSEFEAEKREGE
jgi:hypothetical protein